MAALLQKPTLSRSAPRGEQDKRVAQPALYVPLLAGSDVSAIVRATSSSWSAYVPIETLRLECPLHPMRVLPNDDFEATALE